MTGGLARGVLRNADGPRGVLAYPLLVSRAIGVNHRFSFFLCLSLPRELWHLQGVL